VTNPDFSSSLLSEKYYVIYFSLFRKYGTQNLLCAYEREASRKPVKFSGTQWSGKGPGSPICDTYFCLSL
jgi:hypothetical protein